jgi:acyl-CoA thioester hydrolase
MGLVVERVGTSSVVYRIGLFQGDGDEAAAEGRFVHVYVDNTEADPAAPGGRAVRPLPDQIRSVVTGLVTER